MPESERLVKEGREPGDEPTPPETPVRIRRLSVVVPPVCAGGIARVLLRLVEAWIEADPELQVRVCCGEGFARRDLADFASSRPGLSIVTYEEYGVHAPPPDGTTVPSPRSDSVARLRALLKRSAVVSRVYVAMQRWRNRGAWHYFSIPEALRRELEDADLVYVVSLAYVEPFHVNAPLVGTLHDFNWKHHFVGNFTRETEALLDSQTPRWLKACDHVVLDADSIREELRRFYPEIPVPATVVRLSHFGGGRASAEAVADVRARYGLPERYVLFPSSIARHKNVAGLLRAWDQLVGGGLSDVPLVLTGLGFNLLDEAVAGSPDAPQTEVARALELPSLRVGENVRMLGYVSNADVDALTTGASLMVSPSLYEGGAGPALDAWSSGVPVALSRIPTFTEYTEALGAHAAFFDPNDPRDIADTIAQCLADPDAETKAAESLEAMSRYGWDIAAGLYWRAFESAVALHRGQ